MRLHFVLRIALRLHRPDLQQAHGIVVLFTLFITLSSVGAKGAESGAKTARFGTHFTQMYSFPADLPNPSIEVKS